MDHAPIFPSARAELPHPYVGQSVAVTAHEGAHHDPVPEGAGVVSWWGAGCGRVLFEDGMDRWVSGRHVTFLDVAGAQAALARGR